MAATLKLQTLDTNTYVDLLAGTLKIEGHHWTTRTAAPEGDYTHVPYGAQPAFDHYPPVVETIDLAGKDTGANLTAAIAALDSLLATARRWHTNNYTQNSVWLWHAATGETAARRALVYEGSLQLLAAHGLDPMLDNAAVSLRLTLTRHPFWEPVTSTTQTTSAYTLWGNRWVLSAVPGNEPARVRDLQVKPRSGGGGPLYRLWIGLREQIVTVSTPNLDTVWELEDGANEATATDVADATASPSAAAGAKVQVAFNVTATHTKRMSITAAQAAVRYGHTNYSHTSAATRPVPGQGHRRHRPRRAAHRLCGASLRPRQRDLHHHQRRLGSTTGTVTIPTTATATRSPPTPIPRTPSSSSGRACQQHRRHRHPRPRCPVLHPADHHTTAAPPSPTPPATTNRPRLHLRRRHRLPPAAANRPPQRRPRPGTLPPRQRHRRHRRRANPALPRLTTQRQYLPLATV